jgi:hypothetical protein
MLRVGLLCLFLCSASCVSISTSAKFDGSIRDAYVHQYPHDEYCYSINQGYVQKGMNLGQLKAALSRDDLEYELQKDSVGRFILNDTYITRSYAIPSAFPLFSWVSSTNIVTKYYFSSDTVSKIVNRAHHDVGDAKSSIRSEGGNYHAY